MFTTNTQGFEGPDPGVGSGRAGAPNLPGRAGGGAAAGEGARRRAGAPAHKPAAVGWRVEVTEPSCVVLYYPR